MCLSFGFHQVINPSPNISDSRQQHCHWTHILFPSFPNDRQLIPFTEAWDSSQKHLVNPETSSWKNVSNIYIVQRHHVPCFLNLKYLFIPHYSIHFDQYFDICDFLNCPERISKYILSSITVPVFFSPPRTTQRNKNLVLAISRACWCIKCVQKYFAVFHGRRTCHNGLRIIGSIHSSKIYKNEVVIVSTTSRSNFFTFDYILL